MGVSEGHGVMHIGIAGIGNMGSNIGVRLMEVGHTLTRVESHGRKDQAACRGRAPRVAKTPAELTSTVDVVISLLIDTAAIDAVYHGPQGLLAGDAKDKLFIEMSTVTPEAQVALAEKVRAKGAAFVECPVSGSVIPARAGKLLGLMGAEPADAARARPLLEQMCRRVMHAGPVGSGALLKLAVNLPLMIYWQALGEQLSLCKTLTIDPAELLDFLAETSGAATVLKQRMPGIVAKLKKVPSSQRTFSLDGGIKDVKQMLAEGQKRGARSAAAETDARLLRGGAAQCRRQGRGFQRFGLLGRPVQTTVIKFQGRMCDETVFVLAVAGDLSGAHRDESEGPQAR